jgi:hypothetical protein
MSTATNKFAQHLMNSLGLSDSIKYLWSISKDELQGVYGDVDEDGYASQESTKLSIYGHGQFRHWFEQHLTNEQKENLKKLSSKPNQFFADISSDNRRDLLIEFVFRIPSLKIDEDLYFTTSYKFNKINECKYSFEAFFTEDLTEDEIEKIHLMYELKR